MGSLSDNGGGWPPDGGMPERLPDLPPEWGDIVIPDDISSLADEVAAVRAELHQHRQRTRWQRISGLIGLRRVRNTGAAGLRGPALIVTMAVLVTLASLWASAWPGPARPSAGQRTAGSTGSRDLPALELISVEGKPVSLLGQLPAVILLIDGCECTQLIADTTTAVRPGVAVVTVVSGTAPIVPGTAPIVSAGPVNTNPQTGAAPPPQGTRAVSQLRDPTATLRSTFRLDLPDGNAAALLVSRTGQIVRTVPRAVTVEDIRPDLARL